MLRRSIRGCTYALVGAWSVCAAAPRALAGGYPVFDPPQFIEGVALSAVEDSASWIAGLAPSSDGSVWVVVVRGEGGGARLARFNEGMLHEVAPLEITPDFDHIPCRFVERSDGLLQLVSQSRVWVLQDDGSIVREWALVGPSGEGWWDPDVDKNGLVFALRGPLVGVFDDQGELIRTWSVPSVRQLAVVPGNRIVVVDAASWETRMSLYSSLGELLSSVAFPDYRYSGRLWATPSGTLYQHEWHAYDGPPVIDAASETGIPLSGWWWTDPGEADGGCRSFGQITTEDNAGRLVTASWDQCNVGPRIDVYSPMGPGVIVQPPVDDVAYTVDGVAYTGRQRFDFPAGTSHTVSVPQETVVSPGTRRDFVSWSDAAAASHTFEIPLVGTGLRFDVDTLHLVETTADVGGSVTASPWVKVGSEVMLTAADAHGYKFVKWSHPESTGWRDGDILQPQWTHIVNGPEFWKAAFIPNGLTLTISASGTDPWVNSAAPAGGPRQLWLWAACLDRGISALEADVAAGSLSSFGFEPAPECLNLGSDGSLLLAIGGCPIGATANVKLGSWWVMDTGGSFCLAPSAANGTLGVVDCPSVLPQLYPAGVMGFSSLGDPCQVGAMCGEDGSPMDSSAIESPLPAPIANALELTAHGNPFRVGTELVFGVPADGRVSLRVFDVTGRHVRTLWDGSMIAGGRAVRWDGRSDGGRFVSSGLYFARLETSQGRRTLKLVKIPR